MPLPRLIQRSTACLSVEVFQGIFVWVCRPVLQVLTQFQTEKCYFPQPFSLQASWIQFRFQIWYGYRNQVIIFRQALKQKDFLTSISDKHISLFFYSFGIETTNTFIHPRSPRKLYPIPDKNGQGMIYTRSRPKRRKNHTRFGAVYTHMAFIREYPRAHRGRLTPRKFIINCCHYRYHYHHHHH